MAWTVEDWWSFFNRYRAGWQLAAIERAGADFSIYRTLDPPAIVNRLSKAPVDIDKVASSKKEYRYALA